MLRKLRRAALSGLIMGVVIVAALILLAEALPERPAPSACSRPCLALDGASVVPPRAPLRCLYGPEFYADPDCLAPRP